MANNWAVSKLGTSDFPLQLPGKQITRVSVRTWRDDMSGRHGTPREDSGGRRGYKDAGTRSEHRCSGRPYLAVFGGATGEISTRRSRINAICGYQNKYTYVGSKMKPFVIIDLIIGSEGCVIV